MGKKKQDRMEFRFYEVPRGEDILALYGDEWRRVYGEEPGMLHFHNLMEIGYCLEGQGFMVLDDRKVDYHPGMFSVVPHNYPHTTCSKDGSLNYWEYFFFEPGRVLQELYPGSQTLRMQILQRVNHRAFLFESGEEPELRNAVENILRFAKGKKEFRKECIRMALGQLTLLTAGLNPQADMQEIRKIDIVGEQILPALDYIERQYMYPIRIEELAKCCNMSETHFRRIFVLATNMKPVDYINMTRVQRACRMMLSSQDSMKDIAAKTGFGTVSTFNRVFHNMLGVSPYQWKKNPQNYEGKLVNYKISALKGWR